MPNVLIQQNLHALLAGTEKSEHRGTVLLQLAAITDPGTPSGPAKRMEYRREALACDIPLKDRLHTSFMLGYEARNEAMKTHGNDWVNHTDEFLPVLLQGWKAAHDAGVPDRKPPEPANSGEMAYMDSAAIGLRSGDASKRSPEEQARLNALRQERAEHQARQQTLMEERQERERMSSMISSKNSMEGIVATLYRTAPEKWSEFPAEAAKVIDDPEVINILVERIRRKLTMTDEDQMIDLYEPGAMPQGLASFLDQH